MHVCRSRGVEDIPQTVQIQSSMMHKWSKTVKPQYSTKYTSKFGWSSEPGRLLSGFVFRRLGSIKPECRQVTGDDPGNGDTTNRSSGQNWKAGGHQHTHARVRESLRRWWPEVTDWAQKVDRQWRWRPEQVPMIGDTLRPGDNWVWQTLWWWRCRDGQRSNCGHGWSEFGPNINELRQCWRWSAVNLCRGGYQQVKLAAATSTVILVPVIRAPITGIVPERWWSEKEQTITGDDHDHSSDEGRQQAICRGINSGWVLQTWYSSV